MKDGLRNAVKRYSPPWLSDGTAEKYLYMYGLALDGFVEGMNQAVKARMPGVGDPSALKYIGSDRNMPRGLGESDDGYAARLVRAFTTWRTAGSPYAVLRQILTGLQVVMRARTVSNTAVWHTISETATPDANGDLPVTRYRAIPVNWNWDGLPKRWWRAWVILYPPNTLWTEGAKWGDAGVTWGDTDRTWGTTATPEQVAMVRATVDQWKPQHAIIPWIVICFDNTLFPPTDPVGSSNLPDGLWGRWAKDDGSGNYIPARNANARYWDGPGDL